MNLVRQKREALGLTLEDVAEKIGLHFTTISSWERGAKMPKPNNKQRLAHVLNCTVEDLFPTMPEYTDIATIESASQDGLPFAKYRGELQLGGTAIECYVLSNGDRVISLNAAVHAISGMVHGNLTNYIGVQGLQPYIDANAALSNTVEFHIPNTGVQFIGKGIRAETFLDICRAFVSAFADGSLKTARQKEIALKCSILLSACAKVGLIALIDEATGYQYERAEDALQIKLRLYIAEEMRAWEKTFPDELWEQLGRLTGWDKPIHLRPKWWGRLVMELIYDALDVDVANYLRKNAPPPQKGKNYHQWMTENIGLKALIAQIYEVIGIAKTCHDIHELRSKVAYHYGKKPIQLTLFMPPPNRGYVGKA